MVTSKWTALLATSLTLSGCGYSVADFCDDACDCEGCSDAEYDECIDDFEDAERKAEREGCDDQFDELMSCIDDEFRCVDGDDIDVDGCDDELENLEDCVDDTKVVDGGSTGPAPPP